MQFYANSDERIVELQGETLKVLKALEAVVGHLRKFLVDHSVLPLFEKTVSLVSMKFYRVIYYVTKLTVFVPLFAAQYNSCPRTASRDLG